VKQAAVPKTTGSKRHDDGAVWQTTGKGSNNQPVLSLPDSKVQQASNIMPSREFARVKYAFSDSTPAVTLVFR
jgi:hypothetical protein